MVSKQLQTVLMRGSNVVIDFNTMALHVYQYRTGSGHHVNMHLENSVPFSGPNAGANKLEFKAILDVQDDDDYAIKKNLAHLLRTAADIIELDREETS